MSLRVALINFIAAQVPGFGGKVYQSFTAPAKKAPPYCTVKLPDIVGSGAIAYAGAQRIEVRVYAPVGSFLLVDDLATKTIKALNGRMVGQHLVLWEPGGGDFVEEGGEPGRILYFNTAALHAPA
jgi:hypothetical protein